MSVRWSGKSERVSVLQRAQRDKQAKLGNLNLKDRGTLETRIWDLKLSQGRYIQISTLGHLHGTQADVYQTSPRLSDSRLTSLTGLTIEACGPIAPSPSATVSSTGDPILSASNPSFRTAFGAK